jgi:PP-loop superfamily ATP-utilizing enzyme
VNDKPPATYSLRSVLPPRYIIAIDLMILAKAAIAYGLGYDRVALSTLSAWVLGTAVVIVLVALDVRKNRRIAAELEARGYVNKPPTP